MRKISVVLVAIILALASVASSAQKIEDIPWNEAHIKQLRAAHKHAVFRFFDQQEDPDDDMQWNESSIFWNYAWYPAGAGKYELAINSQSGPDIGYLTIYWQDGPGKSKSQAFASAADATDEWYWDEKGPDLVDANGAGATEVVYLDDLDYHPPPQRTKFIPGGMWPRVFRFRDGKFVEASRDFAAFYDKTIFPLIDKAMAKAQQDFKDEQTSVVAPNIDPNAWRNDTRRQLERTLAGIIMCRDKILRVLGRDPNAGLAQAREWMTSPDPVMVDNARVVFQDIGGHDKEVQAAKLATERASRNWPSNAWEVGRGP
jgi:hypothetical protein